MWRDFCGGEKVKRPGHTLYHGCKLIKYFDINKVSDTLTIQRDTHSIQRSLTTLYYLESSTNQNELNTKDKDEKICASASVTFA